MNAKHIAANTIRGFFKGDRDSKVALRESHIPVETLKRIKTPTLCVVGERDWVKVEHVRWYSQLLPNCRLVLMPRQTHYSYVVHSLKLLDLIKEKVPNIQGSVDFDLVYWDNIEAAKDEARKIKNFDKVVEFIKKHF